MTDDTPDDRSELDTLRERLAAAYEALRILGREVRAWRAKAGQP